MTSYQERAEDAKRALAGETVLPRFEKQAFHCHGCQVFTTQGWEQLQTSSGSGSRIFICTCSNCFAESYWYRLMLKGGVDRSTRIYPRETTAPLPHPEMPQDVKVEYEEAASILEVSPRGAGALLRLALQKSMVSLGETGKNINSDIGALVKKGLDPHVQRALDALRVIGNNSVHPLELDLRDDRETVGALFDVLNFIVEDRIARPRKLDGLYDALPEGARVAIEKRDAPKEVQEGNTEIG